MVFTPTTVDQLNTQVQNALKDPPSYPEGQPDTWVLSYITDWYSTNPIPFSLEDLKNIGMTPSQMKLAWSQMGGDIDGEDAGDRSGRSVSLSSDGTIMAIGARYNDGNGSTSGHVRVFEYKEFAQSMVNQYHYSNQTQDSTQTKPLIITSKDENGNYIAPIIGNSYWTQMGIDIDGEAAGDRSGYSVSLSSDGTIVAIGANYNNGNGVDSGHVRIYQYTNGSWNQMGTDIDGEAASDYSGNSVSLSSDGSIVAIGATGNDVNGTSSGHVRIYQYTNGSWNQMGTDIDGEAASDFSGYSVSLSSDGSIVAIGATGNDVNGTSSGHVRVYEYDDVAKSWSKMGGDIDGEAAYDLSGISVSLSSDGFTVAIGARYNDGTNGSDSGHVRVYQYTNGSWSQLGGDIDGEAVNDNLGWSVSLSSDGSIVAIGAYFNDGNGTSSGHVRVYQYDDVAKSWSQLGTDIDGEAAGDYSGYSVSLSSDGSIVAIGATNNDGNGTNSGQVRVFDLSNGYSLTELKAVGFDATSLKDASYTIGDLQSVGHSDYQILDAGYSAILLKNYGYNVSQLINSGYTVSQLINSGYTVGQLLSGGFTYSDLIAAGFTGAQIKDSWIQLGGDIDGEAAYDNSGWSVSLSSDGTIMAIGAYGNDGNGSYSGHVRVYKYITNTDTNTSSWTQLGGDIDGEAAFDDSGWSVSLSSDGTIVAIGAPYNDSNGSSSGHVRVYEYTNDSWNQLGGDIDGEAASDYSGTSVSLSYDGTIVAIGATGNDVNGTSSGHVRVYQFSDGSWNQLGGDIDGEAAYDYSGWSVSLSNNGDIVAIGAFGNDGNGSTSGHVRVYEWKEFTQSMVNQYHYSNQTQDSTQTKPLIITSKDENGNYIAPIIGNSYWTQMGIDIDGEAAYDRSGYSVSLSGDGTIVAIGAYYNDGNTGNSDDNRGHVRVYNWDGSAWTQMGDDIDGEATDDYSGRSVSLSSDGSIVAIGTYGNDGNGNESGHVRVYQYITNNDTNTSSWTQLGTDIDGEASGDESGTSVSLSSDGSIVAIGAPTNDANGNDSGHVRVYKYGISASTLKDADASARDLTRLFSYNEVLNLGYTTEQLTVPLFGVSELIAAGYTLTNLKNGGANAAELHKDGYSFDQLRVAGFSAADCRNGGMSNSELPTSGFSIKQLRIGGLSAKRMKNAGYNARELYENGYPVPDLFEADYSASEIRQAGVNALQARFGGIKNSQLKTAGYTVEEYKAASYKASRMKEAGYTREELTGIYNEGELDAAGF
jgi:hypothetical protein